MLRLYTDPSAFPDGQADAWLQLLERRQARLRATGSAYYHLVAPDKISVFPRMLGMPLDYFEWHPSAQLARRAEAYEFGRNLIDCHKAMREPAGRFPTYYRTASHWTVRGAYLAYRSACRAMDVPDAAIVGFDDRDFSTWQAAFDLGSMLKPPQQEACIFTPLDPAVTRTRVNAVVQALEQGTQTAAPAGARAVFANSRSDAVAKTIVIFGDACSDYRPSSMTAFFAETFAETHFVWSTAIDYDYVAHVKPDIVLTAMIERSLMVLPQGE